MNKNAKTWKWMLGASLLVNLGLIGVCYVAERQTKCFTKALATLNLIKLDDPTQLPDYWAVVGWTNTVEKLYADFDVAFFGNSITRGSDFQIYFPDKRIINLGYPGDKLTGMMRRVRMLQQSHPKKVFIMGGTNDIFRAEPEEVVERYRTLLDAVRDSLPDATIYVESILPMNPDLKENCTPDEKIRKANALIRKLAEDLHIPFIDLYSLYAENGKLPAALTKDGVHLLPEAYDRWAGAIRPFIYDDLMTARGMAQ